MAIDGTRFWLAPLPVHVNCVSYHQRGIGIRHLVKDQILSVGTHFATYRAMKVSGLR